jgi:hypothetical protein
MTMRKTGQTRRPVSLMVPNLITEEKMFTIFSIVLLKSLSYVIK